MSRTPIEWATHVYNPFTGCDRKSPGCARCYAIPTAAANQRKERGRAAKALAAGRPEPKTRYQNDGDPRTSGPGFAFTVHRDKLDKPPPFPAGARVFVNSMSDVFHEDAPEDAIVALWRVFAARPSVDWLVLTKRSDRMRDVLGGIARRGRQHPLGVDAPWPLPNVWLGVSIENRSFVRRADDLRATSAAVRFISAEPLLGPLIAPPGPRTPDWVCGRCGGSGSVAVLAGDYMTAREMRAEGYTADSVAGGRACPRCEATGTKPQLALDGIDWLIAGGESGPRHRRLDPAWMRDLREMCARDRVAFFVKQMGGFRPGGQLENLPEDLRVRDLPRSPRLLTAANP